MITATTEVFILPQKIDAIKIVRLSVKKQQLEETMKAAQKSVWQKVYYNHLKALVKPCYMYEIKESSIRPQTTFDFAFHPVQQTQLQLSTVQSNGSNRFNSVRWGTSHAIQEFYHITLVNITPPISFHIYGNRNRRSV